MRLLALSSFIMIVARLLVFAGIGLCIAQVDFVFLAIFFIVAGSVLSLVSYLMKSKRLAR
ncbi:hypothetical protein GCM10027189_34200 [Rufibacter soli]|jgi:hypothetical protein